MRTIIRATLFGLAGALLAYQFGAASDDLATYWPNTAAVPTYYGGNLDNLADRWDVAFSEWKVK